MPRAAGDRPDVVPEDAVNFAFLGQFAETARDTIFTTEYSMRTGMEAVYTLLNIDRGVPEVWGSTYDIRDLLNATVQLRDGKSLLDMNLGFKEKLALKEVLKKIEGTDIEKLLRKYNVIWCYSSAQDFVLAAKTVKERFGFKESGISPKANFKYAGFRYGSAEGWTVTIWYHKLRQNSVGEVNL